MFVAITTTKRERERERERETILNYFKSHNIKSAKLENDKLIIEYNNNQQTETKDINDAELEKIKSYSQKIGKSELSLSDLESSLNTGSPDNKSNKGLYIGLAVVVVIVGVVGYFLLKNKKGEK